MNGQVGEAVMKAFGIILALAATVASEPALAQATLTSLLPPRDFKLHLLSPRPLA
jgi:hypothetical protein